MRRRGFRVRRLLASLASFAGIVGGISLGLAGHPAGAATGAASGAVASLSLPPRTPNLLDSESSRILALDNDMRADLTGKSWRPGCPVQLADLRVVYVRYVRFDGSDAQGQIVVHKRYAPGVAKVFEQLFAAKFPFEQIKLVDAYDADDDKSTLANNTSGFNCRRTTGSKNWSQHAYGAAIDINPLQNPYVYRGGRVLDPKAVRFKNRYLNEPGMIKRDDTVVRAFEAIGWGWGGNFGTTKDYQHFSSNGR